MTIVFVPREVTAGEHRVAAIPETVKALRKAGDRVLVERGAGLVAGFADPEYEAAGAELVDAAAAGDADVVLGIRPPNGEQIAARKRGSVTICSIQPMLALDTVRALADAGITACAMDLMPRITRAQKMDILSSQATVGGYQAVLIAAKELPRLFPLLMTAAGTIPPARVVVLGAGVAGLQAIATAKRLGAVVEANDIRPAVKEQVESLGGKFIDTGTPPQAESAGGYAKETSEEFAKKQREILTSHLTEADVVITTALIPGRKAPVLVTAEMLAQMHTGAVVVDMAVEMGGNVEGSKPGEAVVTDNGVKILGELNLPGQKAGDASRMFARNVNAFLGELRGESGYRIDMDNEITKAVTFTHDGKVTHDGAAEALAKGES